MSPVPASPVPQNDAFGLTSSRFGWVNASYVYGLQIVRAHARNALGTMTPWDAFVKAVETDHQKALAALE